jgi:prepilin-type N-terminal cleavage/methylation domain-containing protein
MNTKLTHNSSLRRQAARGFTLIEMIGVLAVIAILAALLIPKVFSAINQARVNGVTVSLDTVKTALVDHYGKNGSFAVINTNGTGVPLTIAATPYSGYDTNVLMVEGFLDKPFLAAIATTATVQVCTNATENAASGYKLDGVNNATASAQYTVEAVLTGVSAQDAKDLNDRIDGTSLSYAAGTPAGQVADQKGRVEYAAGSTTTVYVYLTHR